MVRTQSTVKKAIDTKSKYRAPALEKGLDIIELLATTAEGLTQGEIANALGRSVNEIYRMLNCLQQRGYISLHKPADTYTLALKLFELSHRHPPMQQLIKEALPLIKGITRKLDQSCHLAVCHEDRMVVVAQTDNPGSIGLSVRMGAQLNLLRTASGLVILAFRSDEERKRILLTQTEDLDPPINIDELEVRLAKIRKRGYEESDSQHVRGVRNLSYPVLDFSGETIAALTVPFLPRIDREKPTIMDARPLLRAAAGSLSKAIGTQSKLYI